MGVGYQNDTPAVQGEPSGIFVPGHRTPDVYLHAAGAADGEAQRLYAVRSYGKFLVLSLRGAAWNPPSTAPWAEWVETWDVSGKPDAVPGAVQKFARLSNVGVTRDKPVDVGSADFVVVRPDMYTGYAGGDVSGYFERLFAQ